jgi:hypothetical protein
MKNPLNKLIVPLLSLFISGALVIILHSCSQEKHAENKDSEQTEAVATAWSASGEWVQKLTVSPTNIVRNASWGQDFSSINDSLELAESQPEKGKSYTLYFDDTDLNFSDIT